MLKGRGRLKYLWGRVAGHDRSTVQLLYNYCTGL